MKLTTYALPILLLFGTACSSGNDTAETADATDAAVETAEEPLYVQMALSDMERNPEGWDIDFNEKPKWEYTHGLMMTALNKVYEKTGDERYLEYIKNYADFMLNEDGTSIKTYELDDYNIDRVNPGKFLIELYKETGDEKYRNAVELLRKQMREHPRTSEGGFWHKKRYPHQMWLDGLYMASPFLAKYATEFNEPALYDDVANQIILVDKYTWNEEKGLWHHGWDESREQKWADPETGRSPEAWGRAMGWYAMALVDVLDYFPEDHPKRDEILNIVQKMADAIVNYQDPETGLWWQVPEYGGREGNYLEASASSMFVYFLAKAVKNDYIDDKYLADAKEGYQGILKEFIEYEEDGDVSLTDVVSVSGLGGDPYRSGTYEYYLSEPIRDNDPKGVGPFIMASMLMEELNNENAD
ncbi:glycoside hydrolase family 88/105 protein [Nafulsella turpanensis]|uniref:glycoside hydrolase family 88/105 protein n=1 Tax=Nafulsella turpanensis TaxID=1265690 RepID=UPI000345BBA6|nr:glycoside hydrolase family 88 protein [Nafulsella turpanensis]